MRLIGRVDGGPEMGHPPKATRFLGSETRGIFNQRVPSTLSPLMVPNIELQLLWSASSEFEMKEGAVLTEDEVAACLSSLASSTLASSSLEGASKPARRCEQSLWHHTFLSYGSTHPAIPRGLHESPSCRFLVNCSLDQRRSFEAWVCSTVSQVAQLEFFLG